MKRFFIILSLLTAFASCGQKQEAVEEKLPELTAESETTIEVWSWDVAAKGLLATLESFNKLYPKIKVNVTEFGSPASSLQRATVALNSGQGMPDILQVESSLVQTYAETYANRFMDMNPYIDKDWEKNMDPAKVPVSYDTLGRLVSIPWDSGPVVLFYRKDYFDQAGINPDDIKTWDDYIAAGKKLQAKLPKVKMSGIAFTADDAPWRIGMVQLGTYHLNTNDQITINSPEAQQAAALFRTMKDEGLLLDTVNWSGRIQSLKTGSVATYFLGGWWAGTMKDQAPELASKWRVMKIPAFPGKTVRASSLGGSTLMISSPDPLRKAASLAFIKYVLMTVDAQYLMFNKFALFPSYIPVYADPRFKQPDPYFGGQDVNALMGNVVKEIPPAIYDSAEYGAIRNIAVPAFERVLNTKDDITTILNDTANQIKSSTGKELAK